MKKIINIFICIVISIAISSCSNNNIEIVSQDVSYQLDEDFIFVDIPNAFKFDPSNIVYLKGQTNLTLKAVNDTKKTTLKSDPEIPLTVKLRYPSKKDLKIRLIEDETLISEYSGNISKYAKFPSSTYELTSVTIPAGSVEGQLLVKLKDVDSFNEKPGYFLPLRLTVDNSEEGSKVSSISYKVFVKLDVEIVIDNIDSTGDVIDGETFNSTNDVTFTSSKESGLSYIYDGSTTRAWYTSVASDWLIATFSKSETIKGIKISSSMNAYRFKSCAVYVAEEENVFEKHGVFSKTEENGNNVNTFYIKFKTPVNVRQIKLDSFILQNGKDYYVDITELSFIR